MKKIDYFKRKNYYSAIVVAKIPPVIDNQLRRITEKWVNGLYTLNKAITNQNIRKQKKWTNYLNNLTARRFQLEYPYSRVTNDYWDHGNIQSNN